MDETISTSVVQSAKTVLYMGRYRFKTDHGRLSLPVRWRMEGMPSEFVVALWPIEAAWHLMVLPVVRWEEFLRTLMGHSLLDRAAASGLRELAANTAFASVDNAGRLTLPEELAKKAHIDKEVELCGLFDRFEVWDPERCAMMEKEHSSQAATFFKEVAHESRNHVHSQ
jgi:division/cell wall cluster transcriptional repressor MraZ